MKTSNKLLLGFFILVIVVITAGFIYLKIELNKATSSVFPDKPGIEKVNV
ncbi:MAG: hypothetical protein U0W24_22640 [Bacteroidales bacterium]